MITSYSSTETLIQQYEEDTLQILYESLKCPNKRCRTYLYPPIFMCSSGHSLCIDCAEDDFCCLCKKPFLAIRNSTLEDITQKLFLQCKNHYEGCDQVFPAPNLQKHEEECEHRLYECFSATCPWFGRRWDIASHISTVHPENISRTSEVNFHVDSSQIKEYLQDFRMIYFYSEKFLANFLFYKEEAMFFLAVQYIGKIKNSSKFKYTVNMSVHCKDNAREKFVYQRETHSIGSDLKNVFQTKDCFYLRLNKETHLIEDDFVVNVSIDEIM